MEIFMTTNADATTGDIAAEFSALRQDVARLTATIGDLLRQQTKAAGLGVTEALETAQDKIADTAAGAQGRARAAGSEIETCIGRNPLAALLVAFGVGMSLGMISRSRS
jgi:ElaB/YqjD/DUF883 family membrane-anchored ribosome-binding protein